MWEWLDDAIRLLWSQCEQAPGLPAYMTLKDAADRQDSWLSWRQCALADIREKIRESEQDRPCDAIAVYQRQVGPIVGRTNNKACTEAMVLLRRIRNLLHGLDQHDLFQRYLRTLRIDFRRKRNFMQMLDEF